LKSRHDVSGDELSRYGGYHPAVILPSNVPQALGVIASLPNWTLLPDVDESA